MGKLSACFAIASLAFIGACGSDHATPDGSIKIIDAMPDSPKVWEDAPPGPDYDLSCLNAAAPTTATDPITIAGTTATLTQSGAQSLPDVDVAVFKVGNATALATVTSDSTGAFTTGDIATGGMPVNGYVRGMEPAYRTTYMYPGTVIPISLTGVPVLLISDQLFGLLSTMVANVTQDDMNNGALIVAVTDCNLADPTPIEGATVQVQQAGADVGTILDLGQLASQAAGTFFVFNVPDGEAQVIVTYNGMAFPTRTVRAYKKPMGQTAEGTMSVVQVRPSN